MLAKSATFDKLFNSSSNSLQKKLAKNVTTIIVLFQHFDYNS